VEGRKVVLTKDLNAMHINSLDCTTDTETCRLSCHMQRTKLSAAKYSGNICNELTILMAAAYKTSGRPVKIMTAEFGFM